MMGEILVIGATGHLGRRLTIKLLAHGYQVRAFVRNIEKAKNIGLPGVDLFEGDLREFETLEMAVKGVSFVINTSYIKYADNVIRAIKEYGKGNVQQIIYVGSCGIYTNLHSKSANEKRNAEQIIKNSNLDYTIIRPTMIYGHAHDGNFSRLVKVARRFPVIPIIGNGQAKIQPVFIDDLVEILFNAIGNLHCYNDDFDIGGPEIMSCRELFRTVGSEFHKSVYLPSISSYILKIIVKILNIIGKSPISIEQVDRFSEDKDVNNEKIARVLGGPVTGIKQGILRLTEDMRRCNISKFN